ncbi:hypothetical protein MPSEU_000508500 [Mayamaea pseudoterrestris]|nr:hypothetical protein MPSEU_000508500 [Mayamaea pseudoterrestris]
MGQQQSSSFPGAPPPENQQQDCQPCFLLFRSCGGGRQTTRSNNNNANSSSKAAASFGTPVPDTPIHTRRKREIMTEQLRESGLQGNTVTSSDINNSGQSHHLLIAPAGVDAGRNGANGFVKNNSSNSSKFLPSNLLPPTAHPQQPQLPKSIVHDGPTAEQELHDKYQLMEVLGVGSTSTVHRCALKQASSSGTVNTNDKTANNSSSSTNETLYFACKIIDCQLMEERFQGMMSQFQTEIQALQELVHPGIIRLYDVYVCATEKIYIIMELMEGGELFDYVVEKGTLTEEEASRIVRNVISAIAYMHSCNYIHRDLKPENLLLKRPPKSPNENIDVKIIDFGLSKMMEQDITGTFLGTRGYLSPEQLSRRDYTKAVDSWALGVIVFVLLCGCLPFDDDSSAIANDELVRVKFTLRYPRWAKNLSPSAKDLLSHLLDTNPVTRYTADQALEHPWVRGVTAPKDNVLASPGRIKKSPMLNGSGRVGRFTPGGTRRKEQETPPQTPQQTQMVRKTSM